MSKSSNRSRPGECIEEIVTIRLLEAKVEKLQKQNDALRRTVFELKSRLRARREIPKAFEGFPNKDI